MRECFLVVVLLHLVCRASVTIDMAVHSNDLILNGVRTAMTSPTLLDNLVLDWTRGLPFRAE